MSAQVYPLRIAIPYPLAAAPGSPRGATLAAAAPARGFRGLLGRLVGGIQDLAEGELPGADDDGRDRRRSDDERDAGGHRDRRRERDGFDFD